ncbi:MAG: VOC family protein [Chloroflexota bacterium]
MTKYWLSHIHLMSPDPMKTAEYYERMFGAKRVEARDINGRLTVRLDLSGTRIFVSKASGNAAPGLGHLSFRTDNMEADAELKVKGAKFSQEVRSSGPAFKVAFVEAPEGLSIEVQEGTPE